MFVGIASETKTLVKATFFMDWWTNWFFVSVVFADHQTYSTCTTIYITQCALKSEKFQFRRRRLKFTTQRVGSAVSFEVVQTPPTVLLALFVILLHYFSILEHSMLYKY